MTARTSLLAAILFVDDTDSLHWAPTPTTMDEELIERVQKAGNNWGHLSQESEGLLKPDKCPLYLLSYKFVRGRAQQVLAKEGESVPVHITVS